MNELDGISLMEFVYILTIIIVIWALTNYYAPLRARLRAWMPEHVHNWNNYLIILAVIALVLVNPMVNFLLGIVAALLYYLLIIRKEGVSFGPRARKQDRNTGHLVKFSSTIAPELSKAEAYTRLQARLFAFVHTSSHTSPSIISKDGAYDIEIHLTHKRYEDSLLQYMNMPGITTTLKN